MEYSAPPLLNGLEESERPRWNRKPWHIWLPLAIMIAAIAWILIAGRLEAGLRERQFLGYAILASGPKPDWPNARPVLSRLIDGTMLPRDHFLVRTLEQQPESMPLLAHLDRVMTERILMFSVEGDELTQLLASGRAPVPGKKEVLAGPLCGLTSEVCIDGTCFQIVGRIKPGVAGLTKAYVLPQDSQWTKLFAPGNNTESLWLTPDGWLRLLEQHQSGELEEAQDDRQYIAQLPLNFRALSITTAVALLAVTVAFSALLLQALHALAESFVLVAPLANQLAARSGAFAFLWALHIANWAVANVIAMQSPLIHAAGTGVIHDVFSKGSLSHIGEAYDSGNIAMAALTTFFQNCVIVTYGFTMLPAIVLPFLGSVFGVLKNLLSFAIAGFLLAPVWMGANARLAPHSVTIALELNAYILAAFAVYAYPCVLIEHVRTRPLHGFAEGLKLMGSCAAVVGIILAFAAVYEAVTLIM
jgi:hypothetical protein